MEERIRLFIVDNQEMFRDTLKCYLEHNGGVQIDGEASTAQEAVEGVARSSPDVVLMEIALPDFDGIEAAAQIKAENSDVKLIAVTAIPEHRSLLRFLEAGGIGYIQKTAPASELLKAVHKVYDGDTYLSEDGVKVMVNSYQKKEFIEKGSSLDPFELLSLREKQVLVGLANGHTVKVIAEKLYLSMSTVETYKRRIYDKLEFVDRADVITYAIKYKLFEEV